jgi:predicted transcriptional regulator
MATEPTPLISDNLMRQVEQTAREQNRQPAEVAEDTVRRYLASQRLASFSERMEMPPLPQ